MKRMLTCSTVAILALVAFAMPVAAEQPCKVKASIASENQTVAEGEAGFFNANPSSPRDATFRWQQTGGPSTISVTGADTEKLSFTAPAHIGVPSAEFTFMVTVTGCGGQTASATATLTVTRSNQPPSAKVSVLPADVYEGSSVVLDGSSSSDPDGDPLTYSWAQTGGTAVTVAPNISSPTVNFTAPPVGLSGETLTFDLTVTDGKGGSNTAHVSVSVNNVNQKPSVTIACPSSPFKEGATATITATASDDEDISQLSYSWAQTSGLSVVDGAGWHTQSLTFVAPSLTFHDAGILEFVLTVVDAGNLTGTATCSVEVVDATPPKLNLPANITGVEATAANGAAVTFDATADDRHDGAVTITCLPASGSTFPLGTTTVNCSAKDAADNEAKGSFDVTVVDTTPPALTLPSDRKVEATGPSGASVTFTATATDLVDGDVLVTCTPASGATFALGTTAVNCSATDAHNNKATGSFSVTVEDTTPPALTLPSNQTVEATGPSGAPVTFTATATDLVDGTVLVICSPASGTTFALGATTVSCSATDAHNNKATGSFSVTVQDTTAPALTLPGNLTPIVNAPTGAVVTFVTSATDLVDGNVAVSCTRTSGSTFPFGATTVTCSATDAHANKATGSFTVTVNFSAVCLAGLGHQVLQPILQNGTTIFRQNGSTAPVKFRVCDVSGVSYFASNPVSRFEIVSVVGNTIPNGVDTDIIADAADTQFRWSGSDQFWIFNLSTKGLPAGYTYQFKITLIDGTSIPFQFGLK